VAQCGLTELTDFTRTTFSFGSSKSAAQCPGSVAEVRNQRECALGNSPLVASAERKSCWVGWIVVHFATVTCKQTASLDEGNILFTNPRV
jgi:hypothetical protein